MAFWVELEGGAGRERYLDVMNNYVKEQENFGRFERPLNNQLSTVGEWLVKQRVVSNDARTQVWLAFAFLMVCLINTVGLLLAKFMARRFPRSGCDTRWAPRAAPCSRST